MQDDLDHLESEISTYYDPDHPSPNAIELHEGKYKLNIYAMRALLANSMPDDKDITYQQTLPLTEAAVKLLENQDLREPNNPSLCWPLIVLACTAAKEEHFTLLLSKMQDVSKRVDPASQRRMMHVYNLLGRSRATQTASHLKQIDKLKAYPTLLWLLEDGFGFHRRDSLSGLIGI